MTGSLNTFYYQVWCDWWFYKYGLQIHTRISPFNLAHEKAADSDSVIIPCRITNRLFATLYEIFTLSKGLPGI